MACIGLLVLTMAFFIQTILGNDQEGLQLLDNMGCFCPGDFLTYECTVYGEPGGTTVWTGSAFNCTSREISLFHGNYESIDGAYDKCNNIIGRSVNTTVTGGNISTGYYVSQLTVPISSSIAGKIIDCQYDRTTAISTSVEQTTIPAPIHPFTPPDTMHMSNVDFVSRQLTFSWSPVAPDCPAIHYNILASNCGSCPTTTNHTNVTCTDIPINNSVCIFALQTVVCGNIIGQMSNPIRVSVNIPELTIKEKKDSLQIPSFSIIAVLLLITITMAVVFLCVRFKRIYTSKHSHVGQHNGQLPVNQDTSREEENDTSTTIKTFDNMEMGNYSFTNENYNLHQSTLTLEDEPINLSNLLQKLKGQITSQWYRFGLELGIPKDILNQLNSYSDEDRTVEILDHWLRHHSGKPTWQEVAEAKKKAESVAEEDKENDGSSLNHTYVW